MAGNHHPSNSLSVPLVLQEVVRRGVADRERIAVGGHSYGAFMAANLLAHAPDLFACGIAQSGAYNRTLTPFGFQSEQRTIWEAPETYSTMSPFLQVLFCPHHTHEDVNIVALLTKAAGCIHICTLL